MDGGGGRGLGFVNFSFWSGYAITSTSKPNCPPPMVESAQPPKYPLACFRTSVEDQPAGGGATPHTFGPHSDFLFGHQIQLSNETVQFRFGHVLISQMDI